MNDRQQVYTEEREKKGSTRATAVSNEDIKTSGSLTDVRTESQAKSVREKQKKGGKSFAMLPKLANSLRTN